MSEQKFVFEKLLSVRVLDGNGNPLTEWKDVPEPDCYGMSPEKDGVMIRETRNYFNKEKKE